MRDQGLQFPKWLALALLALGGVLAAYGIWLVALSYIAGANGVVTEGELDYASPLLFLFLAAVLLLLGELFRRADWSSHERDLVRGGRVVIHLRQLPLGIVLLWALVPVAFWLLLVGIPVTAVLTGTGFTAASEDFWMLAGVYGALAAGIVGVFIGSLVKRAAYARVVAQGRVAPERWREFWRVATAQGLAHSILLFAGVGCLGVVPLLLRHAATYNRPIDATAVVTLTTIGALLSLGGTVLAAASWRAGEKVGYAESVA